ncbi:MAG TPA: rhodanese-like domain-containing protein [Bacteroidia bacterium]|nr:rhodanese-like domain-containing protein [Bacteroidia bacterium]
MRTLRQALLIVGCAILAATATAWLHPRRPPWFQVEDPAQARWRLSVVEVGKLMAAGPVVWIDARPRADYEASHLPGALLLNAEEWGDLMFEHQFTLQEAFDRPVVVYCDGESCQRSAEIAQRLRELVGLDPVYVLDGPWRDLPTQ